jgi:hypothetical protein
MIFLMDIVIIQQDARNLGRVDSASALEQVIMLVASHVGHHLCCCPIVDPRWSFSSQLLSIPFLWRRLPLLKKVSNSLKFVFDHSFFFCQNISHGCIALCAPLSMLFLSESKVIL